MTDYLQLADAAAARGKNLLANAYRRVAADPPTLKDEHPIQQVRQQLAAVAARVRAGSGPAPVPAAPNAHAESGSDKIALARQHLAQLGAASAARVGNQNAGTTVRPGSATDKLRAGGGSTLAQVVARASDNVPGSGGVRWKDGE